MPDRDAATNAASLLSTPRWPLARLRAMSVVFAATVVVIGIVVLVGWSVNSAALKAVVPGMITMKVNTSIGLILLAFSIIGLNRQGIIGRVVVRLCLSVVTVLAFTTVAEYITGANFHIDNLLFYDYESPRFPGRSAPGTVMAFIGLTAAFWLLHLRRGATVAQAILFIVGTAPLITLGGYLYRAPGMFQHAPYLVIALHTSAALLLLCIAGLFARSDEALMKVLLSKSLAGWLGRKLLPAAAGLPMLVGLLVLIGEQAGWYTIAFGSALLVACCALFFGAAVLWSVVLLWTTEFNARTEQARLFSAEREARSDAEKANRTKDEFLSVVSHELRTPLNAILGWSQVLRTSSNSDDLIQGVEVIERNAWMQVRIVEDILDMSRIINGRLKLDLQPVVLSEVITTAIESVQPAANSKGVQLIQTLDSSISSIRGDPTRLQQVICNILSNAIKFTSKDGRISVVLQKIDSQAVISISDNGDGMSAEVLPFIFERFRQGDSSTTRRFGGLGLGLSIVKHLVELHAGTVDAVSPGPGQGSTFRICIPVAPVDAGLSATPENSLAVTNNS